jgi:hypothetical protein
MAGSGDEGDMPVLDGLTAEAATTRTRHVGGCGMYQHLHHGHLQLLLGHLHQHHA